MTRRNGGVAQTALSLQRESVLVELNESLFWVASGSVATTAFIWAQSNTQGVC